MSSFRRRILPAFLACAAVVAVSCSDAVNQPLAPVAAPPAADLLGGLLHHTGLLACTPLEPDSATRTIGPDGGTIVVGPHTLTIPPGALDSSVTITAIIASEPVNRVRFEPDGLHFEHQATLRMSYANCGLLNLILAKRIVQVDGGLSILDRLPSLDDLFNQTVTARLRHFSEYAIESDYVVAW